MIKVTNKNIHNVILESCKAWSISKKRKLIKLVIEFAKKEKLIFHTLIIEKGKEDAT